MCEGEIYKSTYKEGVSADQVFKLMLNDQMNAIAQLGCNIHIVSSVMWQSCCQESGFKIRKVASASAVAKLGFPLDDILKAANWNS